MTGTRQPRPLPGDCQIQMPASFIEELHQIVDFSSPNAEEQVDHHLQRVVLERPLAYQRDGNQALGVSNDKRNPTAEPEQFKYMLSYSAETASVRDGTEVARLAESHRLYLSIVCDRCIDAPLLGFARKENTCPKNTRN